MSYDPSVRRILPQSPKDLPDAQMNSFQFAPQQYPQRETQKNYVFVDEHNRHKRLKVMRACEGCRRRKIKCDAATTNTWPCSACIRLKLHCVRPNGYDGAPDSNSYDGQLDQFQQMPMMHTASKPGTTAYQPHSSYQDPSAQAYQGVPYEASHTQPHSVNYTSIAPPVSSIDQQSYSAQGVFPNPQMRQHYQQEPSPEAYSPDSYQQQDLADLLGSLKVDEKGTAPYLRNKASFRREEAPAVEEDDEPALPPITLGPGSKIRIPPELMPDEEDCLKYIEAFFTQVHPYVPVLNRAQFFHQWNTNRESISPLVIEAIFALGGRLRDDPSDGQQWVALASRHADAFMDIPRLSTLQGLLLLLKAREAAPKKGYYYRSWMTVIHCVQMGKDLGLEEHYEEHELGQGCEFSPSECQLRTRIWQTVFVCEVMVGAPQGRHDLAIELDTVDFSIPSRIIDGDETEFNASRAFTYFARVVRNVKKLSSTYKKIKRRPEWGVDPELQNLSQGFDRFLAELPQDLSVQFPPDTSAPWLPSPFLGNLLSYFYLTIILFHRPQLSAIDPSVHPVQWKQHMVICYDAAKALCRLQEAIVNVSGLEGLQCMQRGYSFTVYAGLSCIVLHLVAITSPDPDLNTDARQFFARHMRIMEKVMDVWAMPEVRAQVEAVREAFSADTRKAFVLKPSFPYGSPHPSNTSSPPRTYRPPAERAPALGQHLDTHSAQNVSYHGHPISPPVSAGGMDSKGNSPSGQPLMMMNQSGQSVGMDQTMPLSDHPAWNPARIFEQWNNSFGTPAPPETVAMNPSRPLNLTPAVNAEGQGLQDFPSINSVQSSAQQLSPSQFAAPQIPSFVTPAMWQESVASVYEGGLKRSWDYDGAPPMKRR